MQRLTWTCWPPTPACPRASLCLPLQTEESCRLMWSRGTARCTSPKSHGAMPATTPASLPTASRGRSEPWWPWLWPVSSSPIILETGDFWRKGSHQRISHQCHIRSACGLGTRVGGFYEETVIDHDHQVANAAAFIVSLVVFYSPVMNCFWAIECNRGC